jgi:hypothetical protein
MGTRIGTGLTLGLVVGMVSPAAAQDRFEVPLNSPVAHSNTSPRLLLGSVGLDSHAGNSYLASREDHPYYYNLPGERPFQKVPGVLLRIPLGGGSSR